MTDGQTDHPTASVTIGRGLIIKHSVIVPLLKHNKRGDLSDVVNYGAIALSSVLSKMCRYLVADHIQSSYDVININLVSERGIICNFW